MSFREALRVVRRWRRFRIAAAVSFVLGVVLVFVPQFQVLGFEAAFAVGVVAPVAAGVVAAGLRRTGLALASPWPALGALVVASQLLVAVPLLVLLAAMFRVPVCDPLEGLGFFVLLPCCSAALAAVAGWFLSLAVATSRRAAAFWALAVAGSVALVAWRFMASPAVSFLGPFFGFYPGTLYDALIPIPPRLLTYRATNLLEAATLLAVAGFAWDAERERLSLRRLLRRRAAPFVVAPACAACLVAYLYGPLLGHRTDTGFIAARLGAVARGASCDAYGPREVPREDLLALVEDCDFRVRQIRRWLGRPEASGRVVVLAFRSEAEKASLMGAGHTSVAKPWRREVYVQGTGFPHEVLKHELAHVILGELCSGPFRVPARWGGLLPLPGWTEGGAVAADWPVDELDPHGWAAAMDRLDLLPGADALAGVGFLGEPAGLAYTAMGSFVRWLVDTRGVAAFRRAYRDGDCVAHYGAPLEDLWDEWRAWLGQVPLDARQLAAAQARFDVPGFFGVRCPHAVAEADAESDALWRAGDRDGALAAQREACRLSGDDPRRHIALLSLLVADGRADEADRVARELSARRDLGARLQDVVRSLRADAWWLAGRGREAREAFVSLLERTSAPASRRLLLAKIHALDRPAIASAVRSYLLGPRAADPAAEKRRAVDVLTEGVRAAPDDPVMHYLLGRALLHARRLEEAEAALAYAAAIGLPAAELRDECRLQLVVLAWRAGDVDQAERDARSLLGSAMPEYRAAAADWLERIAWKRELSAPSAPPR